MIKVNNTEITWDEPITIEKLLLDNNFMIHLSIVKINGKFIDKNMFTIHKIRDNDDVKVIHLVAGG